MSASSDRYRRIYFLTPSFRPVGGVVKIFDYVNHARALGHETVICCPEPYDGTVPLFENPRFAGISPQNGFRFTDLTEVTIGPEDLAFFSWPPHYEILEPRLSRWTSHEQAILIVQNIRHANPTFVGGYALRLLSRPMARITTNDVVLDAIRPFLNPTSITKTVRIGHDTAFFSKTRTGPLGSPLKVGYTTWKSEVGDVVASLLSGDGGFEFRAIRKPAGWRALRGLYHWADVFLATPFVEEGFYLPGLEAMAAGAIVVTPDAGGNMAYCRFDENCLPVSFGDTGSYVEALRRLRRIGAPEVDSLRRAGYKTAVLHTLEHEGERFGEYLEGLAERLGRVGTGSRAEGPR